MPEHIDCKIRVLVFFIQRMGCSFAIYDKSDDANLDALNYNTFLVDSDSDANYISYCNALYILALFLAGISHQSLAL